MDKTQPVTSKTQSSHTKPAETLSAQPLTGPDVPSEQKKTCAIFYVSDGTAITAETVGHSLITQFENVNFIQKRLPFIDSTSKAEAAAREIRQAAGDCQPIVINTVVDKQLRKIIREASGLKLDPFNGLLNQMESYLQVQRQPVVGQAHGMADYQSYEARINATNYALAHDDGINMNYQEADVILLGVSRSGKTPSCLYLALQYGVKAANYPLTPEDLERFQLPEKLLQHRHKLFGLTIDPFRLAQIREERRPGSTYSNLRQCQREVTDAEALFQRHGIEYLNTTHTSIEEISGKILMALGLNKRLY
jgi:regulator of PEP synthase PpsR (kinase-PPPase family)